MPNFKPDEKPITRNQYAEPAKLKNESEKGVGKKKKEMASKMHGDEGIRQALGRTAKMFRTHKSESLEGIRNKRNSQILHKRTLYDKSTPERIPKNTPGYDRD